MIKERVKADYFDWLYSMMCKDMFSSRISFRKLFSVMHETEFDYILDMDENRAHDGIDLRHRFAVDSGFDDEYFSDYLRGPCSILELIVALALRCEETIMDDTRYGDRTKQWFWTMIKNLGLGSMTDSDFDEDETREILDRFIKRKYSPDGKGGLFYIRNCKCDLRNVEIWYQLNWYLDSIIGG